MARCIDCKYLIKKELRRYSRYEWYIRYCKKRKREITEISAWAHCACRKFKERKRGGEE